MVNSRTFWQKKESAQPAPSTQTSTDGKEKAFDNCEDLEKYKEKEALKNAKYVYRGDPTTGVLTWSGKGRRPRWFDDYLADGGIREEIENLPYEVINTEEFVIKVRKSLDLSGGPQGSFSHKSIKDVAGDLWFDPNKTLYDFSGLPVNSCK